ncbi:MAG: response regulator [Anaerolineae bacterium]|nr:MAG: response regulator [Anaerolineae bacterium]
MTVPYGPILVVEDVPHILELLAVTLRFKGYPVVTAANGEEAMEQIARERPALVITDILMPRMDGFALLHNLRKDPTTRQIPVIFLSATYVSPEDREFALRLGAARFLEKPVDTAEFLLTVAEILTQGPPELPPPLSEREFYQGYRERLEHKLGQKAQQIARTERLLETLPEEQKPTFEALLQEARQHYDEIQAELEELYTILSEGDD